MPTVLILEDQEAIAEVIKINLESHGFEVLYGQDGQAGLDIVSQKIPDVIILDVLMPKVDGYQFYKKIKANERTNRIPILVMTVRGAMRDVFEGLGADSFLAKPFLPDDLVDQVKKLLSDPLRKKEAEKTAVIAGSDRQKLDMMRQQLKKKGYRVEVVMDGLKALEKVTAMLPQLFVVQFDMPKMSADAILKKLHEHPQAKKVSVVVYSPLQTQEEVTHSGWGRFLAGDAKKDLHEQEAPLKIIDKFDAHSFMDKIKDFL